MDASSAGCELGAPYRVTTGTGPGSRFETAATVTYTGLGTCVVNADFAAVDVFIAAAETTQQRSGVAGTSQTITFTGDPSASATYGGTAALLASGGGSGNPVVFGSLTPSVCTVDAASVAFVAAGTCTITADQAGDAVTWEPAPQARMTFAVAPAELTVAAPTVSFVYGAAVPATAPVITGFIGSDTVDSLAVLPECDRGWASAGSGVHVTTCAGGTDPRYRFVHVAGTATIAPAPATVTAFSGTTGYGLPIPAVTAMISGLVGGDTAFDTAPVCSTTASVGSPVGDYPTACVGAADSDYTITTVAGTLAITAATLVITPVPLVVGYGAASPAVLPGYVGLVDGDTAPATPPVCATSVDERSGVGVYSSICADAADPNYIIGYGEGTVQVTPVSLVVAASALTTTYGSSVEIGAPTYEGLAGGDTAPGTAPVCSSTATPSSSVGEYPISCAGAADPNYVIEYRGAVQSVTRAPLTVTASSWSGTVGTPIPGVTPAYAGLVLGQTGPQAPAVCGTTATVSSAAGSYPSTCEGAEDANYAFEYVPGSIVLTAPPPGTVPQSPVVPQVPPRGEAPGRALTPGLAETMPASPATPAPTPSPSPGDPSRTQPRRTHQQRKPRCHRQHRT